MKIKNIKVEIKPLKEVLEDAAEVMSKIKADKKVAPKEGISFGNVESFREFFTPKRLELLHVIKQKQPKSIYELAKLTGRNFKNVVLDIKILEKYGLIDTKKITFQGKKGYKIMPVFDYDKLTVDIAM